MMPEQVRPYYWPSDTMLLMGDAPYIRLGGGKRILGLLTEAETVGQVFRKYLALYPAVCAAPLEFFYLCRRNLDVFDSRLLRDLLFAFGWREAHWGAWLAMLAPAEEYRALLLARRDSLSHGADIVDLAVAAIDGCPPDHLAEHFEAGSRMRQLLAEMPKAGRPLRRDPDEPVERQFRNDLEEIRGVYRAQGADAALACLLSSPARYYMQSYRLWVKGGAGPGPYAAADSTSSAPTGA